MSSMTRDAQNLNILVKKRKELEAAMKEKENEFEFSLSESVAKAREKERNKRIEKYGRVELQRQEITSALMLELRQICERDDVPPYILAIAKILDNYQGKSLKKIM